MPVLFVGHGSPMNAIEKTPYHQMWQRLGKELPKPVAILVVSAHWLTEDNTAIMTTPKPETIHDFGGFPDELFAQQYPAAGSPHIAQATLQLLQQPIANAPTRTRADQKRGYDHGTWSVLLPMFPKADIPVFQISIDYNKPAAFHYALGKYLAALRERGVMIIGSGNIVHNLMMLDTEDGKPFDWAIEFDTKVAKAIQQQDDQSIVKLTADQHLTPMAHPTVDHFLPLLYVLGAKDKKDKVRFFNNSFSGSSISMRSVIFGA